MSAAAGGHRSVLLEADGGSRGNPGPAAYGAVLKDADTGEVIAESADSIGVATNNVAEYRGLIAGLELFAELTPDAALEVRMDSQLVIEQMAGRWKIKHPSMKPLAEAAHRLVPSGTTWTWIPRERNHDADRLVNEVLDATRPGGVVVAGADPTPAPAAPARGWSGSAGTPTTLVLVRHGATVHTQDKRFSGGLGGSNPQLTAEGRAQVRATADWLAPLGDEIGAVVSSPLRRAHESAEILAERLGIEPATIQVEDDLAEADFGVWEGLTFAEVGAKYADNLQAWLGSVHVPAGDGESFHRLAERVGAARTRLQQAYAGKTVLVVSHVTPIKALVAAALGADLGSLYRMELAAASVTVVSFFEDGTGSLRLFNGLPVEPAFLGR